MRRLFALPSQFSFRLSYVRVLYNAGRDPLLMMSAFQVVASCGDHRIRHANSEGTNHCFVCSFPLVDIIYIMRRKFFSHLVTTRSSHCSHWLIFTSSRYTTDTITPHPTRTMGGCGTLFFWGGGLGTGDPLRSRTCKSQKIKKN